MNDHGNNDHYPNSENGDEFQGKFLKKFQIQKTLNYIFVDLNFVYVVRISTLGSVFLSTIVPHHAPNITSASKLKIRKHDSNAIYQ